MTAATPQLAALLATMRELMHGNDGSLPDVFIDFGGEPRVAEAYALIQSYAAPTPRVLGHFWCEARGRDFDIHYGENPAALLLTGDADPFHVSYETLLVPPGATLPDIGVYAESPCLISINYRRGSGWTDTAILGFFSLVEQVGSLAANWDIRHETNWDDHDGSRLLQAFRQWQSLGSPATA